MTNIGIIIGSTRPGRNGEAVGKWVYEVARQRFDAEFELVDLLDFKLPHLDEVYPPAMGRYQEPHTLRWAEKIASFDGFVIVTAEYNHSIPGALKNAIDFLHAEWNHKAVGFVSYGSAGGTRAVEHLRLVAAELSMVGVRAQVALPFATDFDSSSVFEPSDFSHAALSTVLEQVVTWSEALRPLRAEVGGAS
jgi:NAD(P)H-dependent FMN reductase